MRVIRPVEFPSRPLGAILNGKRAFTPDTAMRIARLFGTTPFLWMNLQARYDLETAADRSAERIWREVEPLAALAAMHAS